MAQATEGAVASLSGSARPRRRLGFAMPLLIASFVAASGAVAAITLTTDEPVFELFLHMMLIAGFTASLIGVRTGRHFALIGGVIMVWAFAAYAIRHQARIPLVVLTYPFEVLNDDEIGLSTLVAWFLVGFSFMQSRRENLVFIFVPGLAIFGLMATINLNPEMLIAFMTFVLASVYCWGYDHFLHAAEKGSRKLDWRRWARAHVSGAALVFTISAVGGLLIGNGLYYTTPRLYTGFGLQQRIWNYTGAHVQGYFLFRQGFQIGTGPIRLSRQPVIKVRADQPELWRGRSYDEYTGQGWARRNANTNRAKRDGDRAWLVRELAPQVERPNEFFEPQTMPGMMPGMMPGPMGGAAGPPGSPPMPPGPGGPGGPPARPRGASGPGPGMAVGPGGATATPSRPPIAAGQEMVAEEPRRKTWEFEPLTGREFKHECEVIGDATGGLFAASYPYRLELGPKAAIVDPARSGISLDEYGAMQSGTILDPGQTYTVWCRIPDFTPEQLRAAPAVEHEEWFREQYIEQVGLEVEAALSGLVAELTAGADTDYDRAIAIKDYLENECLYTLDVPVTPRGRDPVVYFVKSSRRGACDLFASAMTLMCRLAGVPSRLATGFNRGIYDKEQDAFIVRGTEAHAWSEVYFPERGWVPFDLAAAESLSSQSWRDLLSFGHWRLALHQATRNLIIVLFACAAAYLVTTALMDPLAYLRRSWRRWRSRREPIKALALEYEALIRVLVRQSRLRYRPAHTPLQVIEESAGRMALRRSPHLTVNLRSITNRFYDFRYGGNRSPEGIRDLRRDIKTLCRQIKSARKR